MAYGDPSTSVSAARGTTASPPEGEWRPIYEAPRDETRIIGVRFGRDFRLALCWWQPEFVAWISGARLMVMAEGYTIDGQSSKMHSPEYEYPSHWIPLPPQPVADGPKGHSADGDAVPGGEADRRDRPNPSPQPTAKEDET